MNLVKEENSTAKNKSIGTFVSTHCALIIIVIVGFALRAYMAWVDKFLHPWDERFHALVARNMMHHPFKPMLRAFPVTDNYNPNAWCCNHIWLHKQPLFMWQMALSMKIFGISEFTVRLPSVIMGTIMIILLYRLVILLTANRNIALIAAGLLALSHFHLQMISGIKGMDHNDVALGFYVLASIWAYAEYTKRPKWYWIVLVGLFAGCAILNKWLLGLLVFSGWGINILSGWKRRIPFREIKHILAALLICCVVFMPWQLYILDQFPNEARYEYEFNRRHITEVLEGHAGTVFFYLEKFPSLFGYVIFLFPLIGIWLVLSKKHTVHKTLLLAFLFEIIVVFCFLSFIVKTKVDTHFYFVVPLCLCFSAIAIHVLCGKLRSRLQVLLSLVIIGFLALNPIGIALYLSSDNTERNNRLYNASIYRNLKKIIPPNTKVVMNMNSFEDIDVMFYNNDLTAHSWTLPESDERQLRQKRIPVAMFQPRGSFNIPEYYSGYPGLFVIPVILKDVE
jgi:4-amino-4-deoxy-L-arabinose transferase-like glycosyltransferase